MRLAELRKKANISQASLAKKFKVTQHTVSRWETGDREPDNETLSKLADFFDVTIDYLLGRNTLEINAIDPLDAEESKMIAEIHSIYEQLSEEGKEKLREYCSDLLGNPKNLK